MSDDFGFSYLERGWEPPEEVILRRELVRTPGLQPEDLGVLAELLLRDPSLPSTMEAIRTDLQRRGWKMGKDRYNAITKRLTQTGHLARVSVYDEATQRPTWVTRVYRNPANNEQYVDLGITASTQVSPETRVSRDQGPQLLAESRETRVSPGQSRNAENPQSGPGSRKTRDLETRVSPGQSRNAENPRFASPPPTPPSWEEEDYSSSPKPSSITAVPADAPAAAVAAAAEFLAELPGRWACGRKSAAELAPFLAEAVVAQGWALGEALVQQLTSRRIPSRKMPSQVLAEQIEDLPRYQAAARKAPAAAHRPGRERPAPGRIPGQQLPLEDGEHTRAADTAAAAVPVEQLGQARELLLTLTGPWALSPQSADRLAPVLAATAMERGWAFDDRLRTELMKNPGGVHNYELILETHRIGRLPDRTSTAPDHSRRTETSSRQKAIDACTQCDAYGQIEGRGGAAVLCKHGATSAPAQQAPPAPAAPSVTDGPAPADKAVGGQKLTDRKLADLFASMTKADI